MPTWMKHGLIGLFLLLFAAAGVVLALSVQRVEGFFSPVFSPDGKQVYFIAREPGGWSWVSGMSSIRLPRMCFSGRTASLCAGFPPPAGP